MSSLYFFQEFIFQLIINLWVYFCGFKIYVVPPFNTLVSQFHKFLSDNDLVLHTSIITSATHGHTLVLVGANNCNSFIITIL